MSHRIEFALHMLTDWRVGDGTGRHGLHGSSVLRDGDGLPFIPAKTLNGVLRDACEIVARALDSGQQGVWSTWVDYVFGHQSALPLAEAARSSAAPTAYPRPAALTYRSPLRFPGRLRQVLAGADPRCREALTFSKPGVALDPRTGAAREDALRFDEMARGGVTLKTVAELPDALDGDQLACAGILLWAGSRLLEGIGGKRRRGSGRCRLELSAAGMPPSEESLRHWAGAPAPPPAPPAPTAPPGLGASEPEPGAGWERALLRIRLDMPVLVHDRTTGNLVQGRDHVPGWALLPEVLKRLGSAAAHAAARTGDLIVTPATPLIGGLPGCRVPRVVERSKDNPGAYLNRMTRQRPPDEAYERINTGYVAAAGGGGIETAAFTLRSHNSIDDEAQRPTEDLGGVYSYQALAAGTVLGAEVRVRVGVLPAGWHTRLDGEEWRIGRSRKDDYGLISVDAGLLDEALPDGAPGAEPIEAGGKLRVWLLSDVLIRDERLNPSDAPDDFARVLQEALAVAGADGVRLTPTVPEPGSIGASYEMARTDSWHSGWRLPRPVLIGFAAGGCLSFDVEAGRIGVDAVAAVETSGIGERRGEGFGQIRLNDRLLWEPSPVFAARPVPRPPAPVGDKLPPSAPGYAAARIVEREAWRAEIRRCAEAYAADPGNAVLAPLLGLTFTRLNTLRRLFDHLDEPPERLDRRIESLTRRWKEPKAVEGLRGLLTEPGSPWNLDGFIGGTENLCLTIDGHPDLREELRGEALRALLSACLSARTRSEIYGAEASR